MSLHIWVSQNKNSSTSILDSVEIRISETSLKKRVIIYRDERFNCTSARCSINRKLGFALINQRTRVVVAFCRQSGSGTRFITYYLQYTTDCVTTICEFHNFVTRSISTLPYELFGVRKKVPNWYFTRVWIKFVLNVSFPLSILNY